jgi:RNA recognition motif-containing protein
MNVWKVPSQPNPTRRMMTMTEVRLPMDKETGLPRGFAFVSFPTAAEADRALESLDQTSDGHGRGGGAVATFVADYRA